MSSYNSWESSINLKLIQNKNLQNIYTYIYVIIYKLYIKESIFLYNIYDITLPLDTTLENGNIKELINRDLK